MTPVPRYSFTSCLATSPSNSFVRYGQIMHHIKNLRIKHRSGWSPVAVFQISWLLDNMCRTRSKKKKVKIQNDWPSVWRITKSFHEEHLASSRESQERKILYDMILSSSRVTSNFIKLSYSTKRREEFRQNVLEVLRSASKFGLNTPRYCWETPSLVWQLHHRICLHVMDEPSYTSQIQETFCSGCSYNALYQTWHWLENICRRKIWKKKKPVSEIIQNSMVKIYFGIWWTWLDTKNQRRAELDFDDIALQSFYCQHKSNFALFVEWLSDVYLFLFFWSVCLLHISTKDALACAFAVGYLMNL